MENLIINIANYSTDQDEINPIRITVFQQEQGVDPALEFDQYDLSSVHLLAYWQQQAVGTMRFRYLSEDTVKMERLAMLKMARGKGIGLKLMDFAIDLLRSENKAKRIIIHSQFYIKSLYEKLGFKIMGEPFEEAGIIHVKMVLEL
jgi:predicted GNAT family N-acyltransferase